MVHPAVTRKKGKQKKQKQKTMKYKKNPQKPPNNGTF